VRRPALTGVLLVVLTAASVATYVGLRAMVDARFDGSLFALPSQVYARPLVVHTGDTLEPGAFVERLRRIGYRPGPGANLAPGEYSRSRWQIVVERRAGPGSPAGRVEMRLARSGTVREIRGPGSARPAEAAFGAERVAEIQGAYRVERRLLVLDEVPEELVRAVLEMEDRNFYQHQGLDLWRIGGATLANLRAGRIVQGGSTITQQLVKNLFLTPERTLWRKLREAAMALIIEVHREKREILEAYLNEIYLGQRGSVAIHGVAAGARHYFGKSVAELSLAESALLAGMIAAPGRFSPFSNLEAATSRRNLVLGVLHARDEISDGQYQLALTEPIYVVHGRDDPTPAPYFVDWVARQLPEGLDAERLEREGLAVHSTLDADLQRAANDAVQTGLARLEADFPPLAREEAPLQAALIALDPRDGSVLALVGGREWGASQFNRATQAHRQPGSVFKPVVALAALSSRDGEAPRFTLASQLLDEPLSVETIEGPWEPSNFDGEFRGRVSVRETLERSLNVPTARLGLAIGPERVAETGARLGIESALRPVPSLALGSSEVTLLEMTRAYSVLASGGALPRVRGWVSVRSADGSVMALSEPNATRVFDAAETWLVTSALLGAVDHGTGAGLAGFDLPVPVAGKTGTTNGFRDAWFIGYTPELVTGVWVGFDDASSLGIPASVAALPIFGRFMESAVPVTSSGRFARPPQVELVRVNHELGMRAGAGCSGEREEFLRGTAPERVCSNPGWNAMRGFRWLRERLRDLSTVASESRARVRNQN